MSILWATRIIADAVVCSPPPFLTILLQMPQPIDLLVDTRILGTHASKNFRSLSIHLKVPPSVFVVIHVIM
ncbi:hypothetical protein C8Q74DRAFT_1262576 [Fomes fomentarius]|nr:hypothetical protein C8Q74DRAFT_1300090 [Fomes fomentarius]KAI0762777.1 hypothetical protein C8Q74DRAFT_1292018 [Fomes fomentarius]KAI0780011.1 hypothetical protein C8Q74DRAFT_1262576 [Fomes fomentarius]